MSILFFYTTKCLNYSRCLKMARAILLKYFFLLNFFHYLGIIKAANFRHLLLLLYLGQKWEVKWGLESYLLCLWSNYSQNRTSVVVVVTPRPCRSIKKCNPCYSWHLNWHTCSGISKSSAADYKVSADETLGSRVRSLLEALMFFHIVFLCCVALYRHRSCEGLILRSRSPTNCRKTFDNSAQISPCGVMQTVQVSLRFTVYIWVTRNCFHLSGI